VSEYAELEPEEATGAMMRGGAQAVGHNWPTAGAISFERLAMRYRPGLPLVLKVGWCTLTPVLPAPASSAWCLVCAQ